MPDDVTFHSAAQLSLEQLAAALTAVYADFYARMADLARAAGADPADSGPLGGVLPTPGVVVSAARYAETVRTQQVDLARSVAARAPGGDVVGVAVLGRRGDRGWLGDFGVVPAWRGHGLARRLLDAALESARRAGVRRMEFDVLDVNRPAIRVYERAGFRAVGEMREWIADGRVLRARGPAGGRPSRLRPGAVEPAGEADLVRWFGRCRALDPPSCWERDLPALLAYVDARSYLFREGSDERAMLHAIVSGPRVGLMFIGLDEASGPDALAALLQAAGRDAASGGGPGAVRFRVGLEPAGSRSTRALEALGFRPGERSLSMERAL